MKSYPSFVWLGCGSLSDKKQLECFLSENPKGNVFLNEPDCRVYSKLLSYCYGKNNFHITTKYLGKNLKLFNNYNIGKYDSFFDVGTLNEIYPNLKKIRTLNVVTTSVNDYLESIELNENLKNWLYIDVPAQSLILIEDIIQARYHSYFSKIIITTGRDSGLFKGAPGLSEIVDKLKIANYEVINVLEDDFDFPILVFSYSKLWEKYKISLKCIDYKNNLLKKLELKNKELEVLISEMRENSKLISEKKDKKISSLLEKIEEARVSISLLERRNILSESLKDEYHIKFINLLENQKFMSLKKSKLDELEKKLSLLQDDIDFFKNNIVDD